jgi:hypothetical protein
MNEASIMLVGWSPYYFDPGAALSIFSGPIRPTANTNYSYFDDPSFSRRLAAADRLAGPSRYTTYDTIAPRPGAGRTNRCLCARRER